MQKKIHDYQIEALYSLQETLQTGIKAAKRRRLDTEAALLQHQLDQLIRVLCYPQAWRYTEMRNHAGNTFFYSEDPKEQQMYIWFYAQLLTTDLAAKETPITEGAAPFTFTPSQVKALKELYAECEQWRREHGPRPICFNPKSYAYSNLAASINELLRTGCRYKARQLMDYTRPGYHPCEDYAQVYALYHTRLKAIIYGK